MSTQIDRRNFLERSAKALLAAASVYVVGCEDEKYQISTDESGELAIMTLDDLTEEEMNGLTDEEMDMMMGDNGSGGPDLCRPSGCSQNNDGSHIHGCSVSGALSIKLECFGGHTHSVRLSLSDLETLCNSGSISKTSSTDSGHNHRVEINA